jgi:hypothetical protein
LIFNIYDIINRLNLHDVEPLKSYSTIYEYNVDIGGGAYMRTLQILELHHIGNYGFLKSKIFYRTDTGERAAIALTEPTTIPPYFPA